MKIDPKLERLARLMDSQYRIPGLGLRFGWDAILGLLPGLGDTATSLVSLYILSQATRYGVPRITLVRMGLNIALDYILGCIPIVGDLFDAWWKSNQMNIALLQRHAGESSDVPRRATTGDWLFVGSIAIVLLAILIGSVVLAAYTLGWIARGLGVI